MRHLRTIVLFLAGSVASLPATPAAADEPVSCRDAVGRFLDEGAPWLEVAGVHMTSRGEVGFAAFTMRDGYHVEAEPLHTAGATAKHKLIATRTGDIAFAGTFHVVFPDRGNGDEDRAMIWIGRSGAIRMRSLTWSDEWTGLRNVACYRGGQGQLVATGQSDGGSFGTSYWSLILQQPATSGRRARRAARITDAP
jgi:hypothetical protein